MIRIDYLFSYWILFWFIIYSISNNVPSLPRIANPKLALYLGLIENVISLFYIGLINAKWSIVLKYILMIILVKVIPIYLIKEPIHFRKDVFVFILVFAFYNFYLWINQETIYTVYDKIMRSITNEDNNTVLFYLFHQLGM